MSRRQSSLATSFWPAFIGAMAALAGSGLLIDGAGQSNDLLDTAPWLLLASFMGAWLGSILARGGR